MVHHLLQPKQILAGYEIEKFIAKGGMGEVYRARQLNLDRVVALKVLPPDTAQRDPDYARRFVGEAQAAGSLNHPNIIAVYNVGMAPLSDAAAGEAGVYFFVMEYVRGNSVRQIMEKKGRPPQAFIDRVMVGVTKALIYAESRGIVHRDIKPDNIMVTTDGVVKLADLGLAISRDTNEQVSAPSERADAKVLGTPHYMSPEQARGQIVDTRSDQYSLGATLFHLLTGQPPFSGDSAKAIMRAHVSAPVPDPAVVNPDVSPAWRQICMTLMAKQPADRFANSQELRAAIAAAIQTPASSASPRVSSEQDRPKRLRPRRRSTQWSSLAITLGLTLVALAIVVLVSFLGSEDEASTPQHSVHAVSQPTSQQMSVVNFNEVIEMPPLNSTPANSAALVDSPGGSRPFGQIDKPSIRLADVDLSRKINARVRDNDGRIEVVYGTEIDKWILGDFSGENMSLSDNGLKWDTTERIDYSGKVTYKAGDLPMIKWRHLVKPPFSMVVEFLIMPGAGSNGLGIGVFIERPESKDADITRFYVHGKNKDKSSAYWFAIESSVADKNRKFGIIKKSIKSLDLDHRLVQKIEIKIGLDLCPTYYFNNALFYKESKIPDAPVILVMPRFSFGSPDKGEKSVTFKTLKISGVRYDDDASGK